MFFLTYEVESCKKKVLARMIVLQIPLKVETTKMAKTYLSVRPQTKACLENKNKNKNQNRQQLSTQKNQFSQIRLNHNGFWPFRLEDDAVGFHDVALDSLTLTMSRVSFSE